VRALDLGSGRPCGAGHPLPPLPPRGPGHESELVTVTPLWLFPTVFGLYGLVSQRLLRRAVAGSAAPLGEAARMSIGVAGPWAAVMLFPLLVLKWRSSLLVSLAAAVFWAVLLWIFFAGIFPNL
jgi:hypothetical protein